MVEQVGVIFTRDEAKGAWPNRSQVRKVNGKPGDSTPNGGLGRIIGSLDMRSAQLPASYAYFVVWDHAPGVPVAVADTNDDGSPRLELVT